MARETQPATQFAWEGRDRHGRSVSGTVHAAAAAQLTALLRQRGIEVTQLRAARPASAGRGPAGRRSASGGRIKARDVALFTRQLATMLQAGVPLLQALSICARHQANGAMLDMIGQLHLAIATGISLHQALARFPRQFDTLACHLVAAGEQSGTLDTLLLRLASHQEQALALRAQLRRALTYPAAIVVVALIVTAVLLTWVVPAFAQVYASLGAPLPLATRIVLQLSRLALGWAPTLGVAAFLVPALLLRWWRRSARLRDGCQQLVLRLPVAGPLAHKAATARWSRTLATMSAAGIALVDAFPAVGGASGNARYRDATRLIRQEVSKGTSLTDAVRASALFPELMLQLLQVGEQSGTLDAMLEKIAQIHEREVDESVAALATLLEPVVMVVLGVVIGALVLALYLPVFSLGAAM